MQHCSYALMSHPDVTRFEVEDGVVRHAAAELVSEETTIDNIMIDLGVQVRRGNPEHPVAALDTVLSISGATEADVTPPGLADLIVDVAVVAATVPLEIVEVSQLEKSWIGTMTPGPKITAYWNPATADSPAYRSSVEELAATVASALGDVGCRVSFGERSDDWPVTTSISYWFANPGAAGDALAGDVFDALDNPDLVAPESFLLVEAVEHRVIPNPNNWGSKSLDSKIPTAEAASSAEAVNSGEAVDSADPQTPIEPTAPG